MMNLDEAIKHCEEVAEVNHKMVESLVGIDTDEQERCRECAKDHEQLAEWLKELKAYKEQSGDAISRQAVLDAFWKLNVELSPTAIWTIQNMIKDVPSVTPQQRTGRWIERSDIIGKWYECDQCHTDWGGPVNFCPNCGAKMEVEE